MGYKVFVQTKGPVSEYFMRLIEVGQIHSCAVNPDAEFAKNDTTDYRVLARGPYHCYTEGKFSYRRVKRT